mgnify:FL=1
MNVPADQVKQSYTLSENIWQKQLFINSTLQRLIYSILYSSDTFINSDIGHWVNATYIYLYQACIYVMNEILKAIQPESFSTVVVIERFTIPVG